ncbi:MAG: hypothetical protein HQ518_17170 [Rhodopirellula sp.]|nr:hypothetical protein [Rhodopirellula sp.]
MHSEIEILLCPRCGTEISHTIRHNGFKAASTSIGPPILKCPSCETFSLTGQKEWDQQNSLQKIWFWLSRLLWLIVGSFVICGGAAGVLKMLALHQGWITSQQSIPFAITCYVIGTVLLSAVVIRNSLTEINDSIVRSQSDESRAMWTAANPLPNFQESDSKVE